jgi:uncharacterized protein (TIGR03435 family)
MNAPSMALVVLTVAAFGQSETASPPKFEVASIRPSKAEGWQYNLQPTRGGLTATNIPLTYLIFYAFAINDYQLVGAPSWASDRYNIAAKPGAPTDTERRLLVQDLLEDRFKLKVHRERREQTEYALTVAKSGLKLKPASDASCSTEKSASGTPCGRLSWSRYGLAGRRATMQMLVYVLAQAVRHTVVDETGLNGPFDMMLRWTPDTGMAQAPPDAPPPLFVALQEQMGLKLQARKGTTEVIVVDHLERPTEN